MQQQQQQLHHYTHPTAQMESKHPMGWQHWLVFDSLVYPSSFDIYHLHRVDVKWMSQ
jgi:hypothetical protein